jgi:four helix bundle protein
VQSADLEQVARTDNQRGQPRKSGRISLGTRRALPTGVAPRDLLERTRCFALDVLALCRGLPHTDEAREAARQLRRSANSVRNNYRAARKGRSRKLFEDKLGVACEEADECVDWLEYLRDSGICNDARLIDEAHQITAILTASHKTAKSNSARLKRAPKS